MKKSDLALILIIFAFLIFDYTQFEKRHRFPEPTSQSVKNSFQAISYQDFATERRKGELKSDTLLLSANKNNKHSVEKPPAIIKISVFLYITKFYYLCKVQDIRHTLSHYFMVTTLRYFWSFLLLALIFLI